MSKKLFIVFFFTILLSSLFFAQSALASDITVNSGTGTGYINLSDGTFANGDNVYINTTETVEIRYGSGNSDISIICLIDGCNLVINNLYISSTDQGIWFEGGVCSLTLKGFNTVNTSGQYPAIRVPDDCELHISGASSSPYLETHGGELNPAIGNWSGDEPDSGLIVVEGGSIYAYGGAAAAGIGSSFMNGDGYVKVTGGTVSSTGGAVSASSDGGGAGLGGGAGYKDASDNPVVCNGYVEISGGRVTGNGRGGGAGIGGGAQGGNGYINISGGSITANSGDGGSGIGGGLGQRTDGTTADAGDGYVTITGGEITTKGLNSSAGIGGGKYGNGYVEISGGIVKATGSSASGIGGGYYGYGEVTINNGAIEAIGGYGGSGIGGGYGGAGKVIIKDGLITATGDISGAGIGSGRGYKDASDNVFSFDAEVEIYGGTVTATGGSGAAGIGGGGFGGTGYIKIYGGTIKAYGGSSGAGLGGGFGKLSDATNASTAGNGHVSIENADVYAEGGENAAGIGGGRFGLSYVYITSGTVEAKGGMNGAGIGGGLQESFPTTVSEVHIDGGNIQAKGGDNGAGIGGGYYNKGSVWISDGTIISSGGEKGAGIGGGAYGAGVVEISGGTVTAIGNLNSAGIGGGFGYSGDVTISGGDIKATAGYDSAGIGGGLYGACMVEITGGRVETFAVEGSQAGIGCGRANHGVVTIDITGGVIIARGGSEVNPATFDEEAAPGIGGGIGAADLKNITITGGEVYAIGASQYVDDIGAETDAQFGTVTIGGDAAVFLAHDKIGNSGTSLMLLVPHRHVSSEQVAGNAAYNYTEFPDEFNGFTGYGYLLGADVYFDHNWGTPPTVDTLETAEGAEIAEPATDPVRAGYVFNGWHIDIGCTIPFDFATIKATDGLTIYADWVEDGTFKGNLTGSLTDSEGAPVEGAYITLQSRPVTVTTNAAGEFAYGNIYYINHTLIVNDNGGTELKRYAVTFTPGGSPSSSVDEGAGTIDIVYSAGVTGVNIPLAIDAGGTTTTVSGPITFTLAGTDPATGRAINPRTGDDGMRLIYAIIALAALLSAAVAAIAWRKRRAIG